MSVYNELDVNELKARWYCNSLPISNDELIEILFEKAMNDDDLNYIYCIELEDELDSKKSEIITLKQDIYYLEQQLKRIKEIL